MSKADLRAAILGDTHRPDLAGSVDRWIREAEGMIRRDLTGYPLSTVLTDTERESPSSTIYILPSGISQIRTIRDNSRLSGDGLIKVAPDALARVDLQQPSVQYAQYDESVIEIRGNPPQGATFTVLYYGLPAPLVNDGDTNTLLIDHETIYLAGAKYFLYLHTQDRELAGDMINLYDAAIDQLNEAYARLLGGTRQAQAYNFGHRSSY